MRTLTSSQQTRLLADNRSTHLRIKVDPGTGFVDLTDLQDRDWVVSAGFGSSANSPITEAAISIRREDRNLDMSPLISSKLNANGTLLDVGNPITIETAVLGDLTTPADSDFVLMFRGEIDEVDWGSDPIQLRCRDQGGLLVDTFIELQRVYGAPGGTPIEEVMQDILDDNINTPALGSVTLFSVNGTAGTPFNPADSPGFSVIEYIQSKETVFESLRRLAAIIGYDIKYRFQQDTLDFELILFTPDRPKRAIGRLSLTGPGSDGETFVVRATTFTARTVPTLADEYLIGTTATETARNIVVMFSTTGSESGNAGAYQDAVTTDVLIEWGVVGTAGNTITFTEALDGTADGAGTLGGTQLGSVGASVPDFTFTSDQYYELGRVKISRQDIRNVIQLTYQDPIDENRKVSVLRFDAASISKFGRRYMEIVEESNSQIDTSAEASAMALAALEDLSEPDVEQSATLPYFWPVEDQTDLYRFTANGSHYDTDQDLAVVSFSHDLSRDSAKTTIELRGKPSGGLQRWLSIEGRPGIGPNQDLFNNDAAQGVVVSVGMASINITYTNPKRMLPPINDWAFTNIYLSLSGGFTPDDDNLVQQITTTRAELAGLQPGTNYFIIIEIVDNQGNVASQSSEFAATTQRSAPFHEDLETRRADNMISNGEFGAATFDVSTTPPDQWEPDANVVWSVDALASSDNNSGGRSVQILRGAVPALGNVVRSLRQIDLIPWEPDILSTAEMTVKIDPVGGGAETPSLRFQSYDENKVAGGTITLGFTPTTTSFETKKADAVVGFATTRYLQAIIRMRFTDPGTATNVKFDRVALYKVQQTFRAAAVGGGLIVPAVATTINFNTPIVDVGTTFTNPNATARHDGPFGITGKVTLGGVTAGTVMTLDVFNSTTTTVLSTATITALAGQNTVSLETKSVLVKNDLIQWRITHNDAGNLALVGAEQFTVASLTYEGAAVSA